MSSIESDDLSRQALRDLAERARGGIFIHLLLWLVFGWMKGLTQTLPLFFWSQAALFAFVLVMRFIFERRLAKHAERTAGNLGFMVLLLWNPFQWGMLGACSLMWPPLQPIQMSTFLILGGVVAAGGMGLAIVQLVRLAYPLLAIAPVTLSIMFMRSTGGLFIASVALIFVVYVVRASKVVHADYWNAAHARVELEIRARQLEKLSVTDALTQVHNRQFLDRQLTIEWARDERDSKRLSLLMIDIDNFKQVNDTHGHPFGDTCLIAVAQALQTALMRHPGDLVARYGGEEFVVLLPGTGIKEAALAAERLHRAVSELALERDGHAVPLTCSIGVHSVDSITECTAADVLSIADKALYAAKLQGRNRVVTSLQAPVSEATKVGTPV